MRSTTSGKAVINTYPSTLSNEGDKAFFSQNPGRRWRARPASQREAQQVRLFDSNDEGYPVSIVLRYPDGTTFTIPLWSGTLSPSEVDALNDTALRNQTKELGYDYLLHLEAKYWGDEPQ
jgi:hypothetical protein